MAKCIGCGAELQDSDSLKIGYTTNINNDYCVSCYKLLHYGVSLTHDKPEILDLDINHNDLVLLVCGVFYLDNVFNLGINYPNMVLVVNQIDLLPEYTNLDNFKYNLERKSRHNKYKFLDIFLMSGKTRSHINALKNLLDTTPFKNVYLMGQVNSGKSTIFNGLTGGNALTSTKRGLTRGLIYKEVDGKCYYDTVGFDKPGYIDSFLDYEKYKSLIPLKTIHPKIYQVNKEKGYNLSDLVGICVDKQFVLYASFDIEVTNLNVNSIINNYQNSNYKEFKFSKSDEKLYQITIFDLALIHIKSPFTITIYANPIAHISIKEALFK
jgi:ribosome biogenesis GTPase A